MTPFPSDPLPTGPEVDEAMRAVVVPDFVAVAENGQIVAGSFERGVTYVSRAPMFDR